MPTVTINIAGSGTQLATGETSSTGHMWYSLDDGDGNTSSYGFAPDPAHEGWPLAPGEVHRNDDTNYQGRDTSVTIPISQAQYDAMKNFGENPGADGFSTFYNGLANSCIDFTWAALEKAGLNPSGFEGFFWPTWNGIAVPTINMDSIRNMFQTATVQPSPLILDLDGDGVETTPVNADAYFDHAGDGFAEQTGWVGADDGLLVYDRNANGTIDTGAELFGDNTLLADGARAANGFAALAELDSNLDGKIDAQDTAFADLRVWKDADSNGYTSDTELLTLLDAGVQSINTGYTNSTLVDTNGNAHRQTGTFTRTDGAMSTITDVWFQTDAMHTIATEWLEVPDDIAALPA